MSRELRHWTHSSTHRGIFGKLLVLNWCGLSGSWKEKLAAGPSATKACGDERRICPMQLADPPALRSSERLAGGHCCRCGSAKHAGIEGPQLACVLQAVGALWHRSHLSAIPHLQERGEASQGRLELVPEHMPSQTEAAALPHASQPAYPLAQPTKHALRTTPTATKLQSGGGEGPKDPLCPHQRTNQKLVLTTPKN